MTDIRKDVRRLYRGLDAFEIPKHEETKIRATKGSPVYGELTATGVMKMLDYLELGTRDVFYDLGSGSGKVIVQAALTVPVRKCVGVELSSRRVMLAKRVLREARRSELVVAQSVGFRCEDLLETYLNDATVIYTCSTAFSARFLRAVAEKVAERPRSIRFLTLQELERPPVGFRQVGTIRVPTTWTRSTEVVVYVTNDVS